MPDLRGSSNPFKLYVWHSFLDRSAVCVELLYRLSCDGSTWEHCHDFHPCHIHEDYCKAILNHSNPRFSPRKGGALDPLPWNDYFARELYLKLSRPAETVTYHVYITPPQAKGPLIVTHHGAGSSGLSFALFASGVRRALPDAGVLSLDARGHGETVVEPLRSRAEKQAIDLCLGTLSEDLVDVIRLAQKEMDWSELPGLVLIGHSLGGAVVTDVAASGKLGNAVLGYAVLDVVEGSAIDALQSMQSYLSTRPRSFPSIPAGIEWQ